MPRHLYTPEEWRQWANFVLPRGAVGEAIQWELTLQRLRDRASGRVTRVTPAAREAAVRSMKYEELADEAARDRMTDSDDSRDQRMTDSETSE